jgi:hypothetical protein
VIVRVTRRTAVAAAVTVSPRLIRLNVGRTGPPGVAGGGTLGQQELVISTPGEVTAVLLQQPQPGSARVFVNGLQQRMGSFIVSGQTLTLPADLDLEAGDVVTVEYTY